MSYEVAPRRPSIGSYDENQPIRSEEKYEEVPINTTTEQNHVETDDLVSREKSDPTLIVSGITSRQGTSVSEGRESRSGSKKGSYKDIKLHTSPAQWNLKADIDIKCPITTGQHKRNDMENVSNISPRDWNQQNNSRHTSQNSIDLEQVSTLHSFDAKPYAEDVRRITLTESILMPIWKWRCHGFVCLTILCLILGLGAWLTKSTETKPTIDSSDRSLYDCNRHCPNVDYTLVARLRRVPLKNLNADVFSRGFCPEEGDCDLFGPMMKTKPGTRLTILVKNQFDPEVTQKIGPRQPVGPDDWVPFMNNVTGRYAGMSACGFTFLGDPNAEKTHHMHSMDMPHNFDETNLHLHGLMIQPHLYYPMGTSNPEATMINIRPGECYCYQFDVHPEQTSGSFWYHTHRHGSTAVQTWGGMAGLLRVEGDDDKLSKTLRQQHVVREEEFVVVDPHLQELPLEEKSPIDEKIDSQLRKQHNSWDAMEEKSLDLAQSPAKNVTSPNWFAEHEESERLLVTSRQPVYGTDFFLLAQTDQSYMRYLVNGEDRPTFELEEAEHIRLRVLCATTENLVGFRIMHPDSGKNITFTVLAYDGITLPEPIKKDQMVMGGGHRVDLLIGFDEPGQYEVWSDGLSSLQFFCTGPPDTVLARFNVSPGRKPTPVPQLSQFNFGSPYPNSIQASDIVRQRFVTFSLVGDVSQTPFPQFHVNSHIFEEKKIEFNIKGGEAEEWILINSDVTMHPFHSHVVPFQVREIQSAYRQDDPRMQTILSIPEGQHRDSVIVPSKGFVKIWIRWPSGEKYTGKTVIHCHFLAHEDTGMIANIMIQ